MCAPAAGQGGSKSTADAPANGHMLTTDAAAQADLNTGPLTASHYPSHQQPQSQASPARNASHPTMEVHAVHTRDIAVGSGSDGSQPKRRKRTTAAKNAHARANGGYGNHASHAPHSGYGHHPIHGHYMHSGDYEIGHGHTTKSKKQAVHKTPKEDDKGPCLNPACRTTGTFCRVAIHMTKAACGCRCPVSYRQEAEHLSTGSACCLLQLWAAPLLASVPVDLNACCT